MRKNTCSTNAKRMQNNVNTPTNMPTNRFVRPVCHGPLGPWTPWARVPPRAPWALWALLGLWALLDPLGPLDLLGLVGPFGPYWALWTLLLALEPLGATLGHYGLFLGNFCGFWDHFGSLSHIWGGAAAGQGPSHLRLASML